MGKKLMWMQDTSVSKGTGVEQLSRSNLKQD